MELQNFHQAKTWGLVKTLIFAFSRSYHQIAFIIFFNSLTFLKLIILMALNRV